MLIQLIPLLHYLVHVDFFLVLNDWLTADRACVVVVRPAQQTLDMKDMIDIAL